MKERLRDKKRSISKAVCSVVILLTGLLWTTLTGYLLQTEASLLYRNLLVSVLISFVIIFSYMAGNDESMLFHWNRGHVIRFTVIVCVTMAFLAVMGEIPFLAAPVSAVAIVLTVFSGSICGLFSYIALTLQYCLLYGCDREQMMVLLLTGIIGAVLFFNLNRSFRYAGSLFAFLTAVLVCYGLFFVITRDGSDFGDALLYIGIQLFSVLIGLLILLKVLGNYCIYRDDNVFAVINDPEYGLLVQLKELNKDAYFHAIHTAYLSEKVARRIGIDSALTKAGGYYHRIGLLQGKDTIQNTILVGAANHFPQALIRLLKEYGIKNTKNVSKEAAVVQISDVVVSSISYMFQKDKNAVLSYDKIVDVILKKKIESGDFDHCQLTMEELSEIKKCFAEEKLYYDFLR